MLLPPHESQAITAARHRELREEAAAWRRARSTLPETHRRPTTRVRQAGARLLLRLAHLLAPRQARSRCVVRSTCSPTAALDCAPDAG